MNQSPKHIILGAGGAIANVLTEELLSKKESVKLVSRAGYSVPGSESSKADLTNPEETSRAIEESSIVYLVAGLPYDAAVWQAQWPRIMQNTVEACKAKNAKLIFFDNVYLYGRVNGPMTEETPPNPCSKKGEVRAEIAEYLMSQVKGGNIVATLARSADFYGPYSEKGSVPFILVIDNLAKGKKAMWLVNPRVRHSFTYTGDCGKALYLLTKADDTFNQIWHLPTASPPPTGEEFIKMVGGELSVEPSCKILRKWMLRLAGVTNNAIRESFEMLYQSEFDYIFDSSKFEKRFGFTPTPYEKGIEETIGHFKRRGLVP